MFNPNIRQYRPQNERHSNSNNYYSSRGYPETSFNSNPRFLYERYNELQQQSNQYLATMHQRFPIPVHIPSSESPILTSDEQFYANHVQSSDNRPFYHVGNHLSYRTWSNTAYQKHFHQYHQQHFKISLICYNILAQSLLENNPYLYQNCQRNNLKWYRRKERLLREFLRQDAHIICLQEMENYHYEIDFRPKLMEHGYDSIYVKRSGDKTDGCCIFYKATRLKLVQSKAVSFYQKDIPILNRDNCGLIALFQPIGPNVSADDLFCVATTHLLFSPKRGDIKLAQLQYFLAEIDRLAIKHSHTNSYYPIILCGDLNSVPSSPLIQFLLNQYIKYDTYRCIDISGQAPNTVVKKKFSYPLTSNELLPSSFVTSDCRLATSNDELFPQKRANEEQSSSVLTHNKQLLSVYDINDSLDVTSHVDGQSNSVDYILYTKQEDDSCGLHLLSRYDLYKQNQMIDIHMPNHQFPSDHFLLAATFALKLTKKN